MQTAPFRNISKNTRVLRSSLSHPSPLGWLLLPSLHQSFSITLIQFRARRSDCATRRTRTELIAVLPQRLTRNCNWKFLGKLISFFSPTSYDFLFHSIRPIRYFVYLSSAFFSHSTGTHFFFVLLASFSFLISF